MNRLELAAILVALAILAILCIRSSAFDRFLHWLLPTVFPAVKPRENKQLSSEDKHHNSN